MAESQRLTNITNYKYNILKNICYTQLVYARINKKLQTNLTENEIEEFVKNSILEASKKDFTQIGKNIYIVNKERDVILTINLNTNRVITASRVR